METPPDVQEWLEYGMLQEHHIEHVEPDELEGLSVLTGTAGNTISGDTVEFLQDHLTEDRFVIVRVDEYTVGDMAIPFNSRLDAAEFEEEIRDDGGSLRLSAGEFDGWYCYEAE